MKSGNLNFLEPSGPLQACNGTTSHIFIYEWFGRGWLYYVQNLLPWNIIAVNINNINKVVLMVRRTNYYHWILLEWSDQEDGIGLGRDTSRKQTILQWINLAFFQIYSMTVRLSAMFEEHMKTVISNWKCAQRHSVLAKLSAARRKRKPTSKTSSRRDAASSQPGAGPNQAGLYVTAINNCEAISFSWVLTCCEFWGSHSAIMRDSLFLGCPWLSLLTDLRPLKMKATYSFAVSRPPYSLPAPNIRRPKCPPSVF